MTREDSWDCATIRVLACGYDKKTDEHMEDLKGKLKDFRIEATAQIVQHPSAQSIPDLSKDAAMVFLPFKLRGKKVFAPFDADAEALMSQLPLTALVLAAEGIDLDAEPEEGKPKEIAEALDALEQALKRRHETERNAEKAARAAAAAEKRLADMMDAAGQGVSPEVMERIEKAAKTADMAREDAETKAKKAASAQARAQQVADEAASLGVAVDEKKEDAP
jgi:hypothetical protein